MLTKLTRLAKALNSVETAIAFYNFNQLKQSERYHYVFITHTLSEKICIEQITNLTELSVHLYSLARLKKLDQTQFKSQVKQRLQNFVKTPNIQRIDLKGPRNELNQQAASVAQHYLGQPKSRSGNTWRYDTNKGSLVITINGPKQGYWRDFQTNEGGDMLSLIQHSTEIIEFKEVIKEATRFVGGYSIIETPNQIIEVSQRKSIGLDAYTQQKIKAAEAIYQATQAIEGTLAERYLQEHRGIYAKLYDQTFRYHPSLKNWMTGETYPALIVVARNDQHQVCGIQAIFLDPATAKKAPLGHQAKLSRGVIGEGALVHSGLGGSKIAFAEGPETALSVAEAHPDWAVYVSFGVSNFDKAALKTKANSIVICADNDGLGSGTAKSIERSAKKLSEQGIEVWVAEPQKPSDQKKWDFNDALLQQGKDYVKADLDNAVLFKKGLAQENLSQEIKENLTILNKYLQDVDLVTLEKKYFF